MQGTSTKKPKIKYTQGNQTLLDEIKPLWEGLNEHNLLLSPFFKQHYQSFTFEIRKAELRKKACQNKMRIDFATDKATTQHVGYLVSSINKEKTGEIDSIFVSPSYRGFGIGDALMKRALAWMDKKGVAAKIVEISVGNEQTLGFYSRYGFYPRKTLLKQIKEC
ncbi:MAG: GNAT family N-acetyltransferase [Candidatus Bathyarchaeia archaeon]|jgi:ribosomal protein S18 acetylase RimI-like enzyme